MFLHSLFRGRSVILHSLFSSQQSIARTLAQRLLERSDSSCHTSCMKDGLSSLLSAALLAGVAACTGGCDASPSDTPSEAQASKQANVANQPVSGKHAVQCGCTLEHVGHCGEYVEVDGQFVELELPPSSKMGDMPFCGKSNLSATVEGRVVDGKVMASKFEIEDG